MRRRTDVTKIEEGALCAASPDLVELYRVLGISADPESW